MTSLTCPVCGYQRRVHQRTGVDSQTPRLCGPCRVKAANARRLAAAPHIPITCPDCEQTRLVKRRPKRSERCLACTSRHKAEQRRLELDAAEQLTPPSSGPKVWRRRVPPTVPTTAAPGSPEKVVVMRLRDDAGQQLFHWADAQWAGDRRPAEWLIQNDCTVTDSGPEAGSGWPPKPLTAFGTGTTSVDLDEDEANEVDSEDLD